MIRCVFAGPITLSPEQTRELEIFLIALLVGVLAVITLVILWIVYLIRRFALHKPSTKLRNVSTVGTLLLAVLLLGYMLLPSV